MIEPISSKKTKADRALSKCKGKEKLISHRATFEVRDNVQIQGKEIQDIPQITKRVKEAVLKQNVPGSQMDKSIQDSLISNMRDWNFIVFKIAGHGLEEDIKRGLETLKKSGTTSRAYITVRAEQDGKISDWTVMDKKVNKEGYLSPAIGGKQSVKSTEVPMLSEKSMTEFLLNSMKRYPARNYLVSFEGHSAQVRKVIPEIHKALEKATKEIGKKIGILLFDSCFMGQIETASEFKDVADVLVASQEGVVGFRPYEKLVEEVEKKELSPKELAKDIVKSADEFTFSAVDLKKIDVLNPKIKALGEEILKIKNQKDLKEIREEIKKSQHYYTEGISKPNTFRNAVDLYDFLSHLTENPVISKKYPQLIEKAKDILKYLKVKQDGVIFSEKHKKGIDRYLLDYTNIEDAHGLSIFLPVTPEIFRDEYIHFKDSTFAKETNWEKVISHITSSRNPTYLAESFTHYFGGLALAGINYAMERGAEELRSKANLK